MTEPTREPAEDTDANRFQAIVVERCGPMPGTGGDDFRSNDLQMCAAALVRVARTAAGYGMNLSDLMQLAVFKLPAPRA